MLIGLSVLLLLFLLACYEHDVICLQAEVNRISQKAQMEQRNDEEILAELSMRMQENGMGLLLLKVEEFICMDGNVSVSVRFPFHAVFQRLRMPFSADGVMESKSERFFPEQILRQSEAIGEMLE